MNRKIILIPELKPDKNPEINMINSIHQSFIFPISFLFSSSNLKKLIASWSVDHWEKNSFYFNINLRLNKNKNWNISTLWLDNSIITALLFRTNNIKYKKLRQILFNADNYRSKLRNLKSID